MDVDYGLCQDGEEDSLIENLAVARLATDPFVDWMPKADVMHSILAVTYLVPAQHLNIRIATAQNA